MENSLWFVLWLLLLQRYAVTVFPSRLMTSKMEQEPETRPTRDFTMFTDRMTQELARRIISGSLKESRRHLLLATQFCKSANIICNITYNNFVKIFKRRKLFEFIIEK